MAVLEQATEPKLYTARTLQTAEQMRAVPGPAFPVRKISLSGLHPDEIGYNGAIGLFRGPSGRLQMRAYLRVEPRDPSAEESSIELFELNGIGKDGTVNLGKDGLRIEGQDAKLGTFNGQAVVAYNATTPHPEKEGYNICKPQVRGLTANGQRLEGGMAYGLNDTKDAIMADLGGGHTILVPRDRTSKEHPIYEEIVNSALHIGVARSPQEIAQLTQVLADVATDPRARIQLLQPNHNLWYGAESVMPLLKKGPYRGLPDHQIPVGVLAHTASFTYERYSNGCRGRLYDAIAFDAIVDVVAGGAVSVSAPHIIGRTRWIDDPMAEEKKRMDIGQVLNPRNLLVGIDERGNPAITYLVISWNDIGMGLARINYPFHSPPEPYLNQYFVAPAPALENLLAA